MYSRSGSQIRHGYSVVRVSLDDRRHHTVPVGEVAWQTTSPWYGWRWLRLDLPKAMNPMDEPDTGIEALFEPVVQPGQTGRKEAP